MSSMNSYSELTRPELERRLRAAEDVCVLFAWTSSEEVNERDAARMQAWMNWHDLAGPEVTDRTANPHLNDAAIRALAEERWAKRQGMRDLETLREIPGFA